MLAIILMILCGALVAAGFLMPDLMIHAFIAAAVALAAGVALFIRASRRKTENYEAAKQRRKLLAKYKAESEDDIAASIDEYLELYKNYAEAQRVEKETANLNRYDYVVINDRLDKAVEEIIEILNSRR